MHLGRGSFARRRDDFNLAVAVQVARGDVDARAETLGKRIKGMELFRPIVKYPYLRRASRQWCGNNE